MEPHRKTDWAFFSYFLLQIPTTLIFDSQGVYPSTIYPQWAKALRSAYLRHYRDPFLADAWSHPWYLSICLVEHSILVPFFFWATYIYYKYGAGNYPGIRIPCLMYGVHTATVLLGVFAMATMSDFSKFTVLAPRTWEERLHLCSAYAIFFAASIWMVVDNSRLLTQSNTKGTKDKNK